MTKRKSLQELTLLDRFLFDEVMEDPENFETVLKIILGKEIDLPLILQSEKEIRTSPLKRFIKLDIWAEDEKAIYDAEVQKENTKNLPKRSRYYQGIIDSKQLEPGVTDFNQLKDVYVIMITPFDLFGDGKYLHRFEMCEQSSCETKLKDGAVRIFLNTHGNNDDEVSPELVELLHYIEHTNEDYSITSSNESLQRMKNRVWSIQHDAEVSVRYMQAWEEKIFYEQKAREEGREEGREAMCLLIQKLAQDKRTDLIVQISEDDKLCKQLMEEYGIQ